MVHFVEFIEAGTTDRQLKEGDSPHFEMPDCRLFICSDKVIAVRESMLSPDYCQIIFRPKDFDKNMGESLIVKGTIEEVVEKLSK